MNTRQGLTILFKGVNFLVKMAPHEPPPKINYMQIADFMPKVADVSIFKGISEPPAKIEIIATPQEVTVRPNTAPPGEKTVATSCIACSRSHLATIAGALDESLRFAREGGVMDPEVIRRLDIAEREVTMMERIDLSPEAIQNSPAKEQEMARSFLPRIRELRQNIGQIASVDQLERAAADASVLTHEFRLRQMQMEGANLQPIMELARAVQSGEMTLEQARAKVKEYLPQGV